MAQWYAQLVFKGGTFLGEGLTDFALVEDVASPNPSTLPAVAGQAASTGFSVNASTGLSASGGECYTTVIVSGYALYGQLRGYYALGVAHISVDPASGQARYLSEQSVRHQEPVDSLTPAQRAAIREWLISLNQAAWENSTDPFRRSLS